MSTDLTVRIQAEDGASRVFQAIGRNADGMARSAEQAGTSAARGLQQIDKQAAATERSVGDLGRAFGPLKGAVAGLAGSALVGFLSDSARAAADAEAVMARLETAVGNTGAAFSDMEPAINAALDGAEQLAFDGEAAADALATLTNFTGDANEALDLLGLTMDIARARGVDLATAANAVGKAAEGNVGALSRMGVAVAEGATAQEALAAAQATFAGQADAYANTTQGAFDRIAVAAGNFQESIGGILGPAATLIGILPGLSSGFSMVSSALGGITAGGGAAGVLSGIGGASGAAVGPVAALGPAIAAVGVAAAAAAIPLGVFTAAMYLTGDPNKIAAESFDEVLYGMDRLGLSADSTGTRFLEFARSYVAGSVDMRDITGERTGEVQTLNSLLPELVRLDKELFGTITALIDPNKTLIEQYDTLAPAIAMAVAIQRERNRVEAQNRREITASADAQYYQNASAAGLVDWIELATDKYGPFIAAEKEAQALKIANTETTDKLVPFIQAEAEAKRISAAESLALAAALRDSLTPALLDIPGAFQDVVNAGDDYLDLIDRVASGRVDGLGLADDLNDAQQALSGTLGAMEQIASLNDPIEQAVKVVDDLMAPLGEAGALEDWFNRAATAIGNGGTALGLFGDTLTDVSQVQDEYNAVLGGQVILTEANERAQNAVNEMLLAQVPLVADQASALADYIESLRQAPELEQQRAFYLMDSANAAKVAAAQSTIYSAAVGEIPTSVATEIIANSAAADPVLFGILEELGYIEQGANGEITVTIPEASDLALSKFETMFGAENVREANGLIYVTDADGNQLVYDQFENLVDKTVTATVNIEVGGADSDAVLGALAGRGLSAEDVGLSTTSTVQVGIGADDSEFQRILADSRAAAEAWSQEQYEASLLAQDDASATIDNTEANAQEYADGTYDASMTATDNASTTIDVPQTAADNYAGGVYDGNITATDNASGTIGGVQSAAQAYVAEYGADLSARDLASAIIQDVSAQLVNLDGDRATVYVDVVQSGAIPGRRDGGVILPDVPRAANGRVVMVGEAGPEMVVLPYGARVIPTGASQSRLSSMQATGSAYGKYDSIGDARRAYADGKATADEFFGGLLDRNEQRLDEVKQALSEPFDTKDEALAALQEYDDLKRSRDQLKEAYRRARRAERDEAKAAARETGAAIGDSATSAANDVSQASDDIVSDIGDIGLAAAAQEQNIGDLADQLKELDGTFTANLKTSGDLNTNDLQKALDAAEKLNATFKAELNANMTSGFDTAFGNNGTTGVVDAAASAAAIFDATWKAILDGDKTGVFDSVFGANGSAGSGTILGAADTAATDFSDTFTATLAANRANTFSTFFADSGKAPTGTVVGDASESLDSFGSDYTATVNSNKGGQFDNAFGGDGYITKAVPELGKFDGTHTANANATATVGGPAAPRGMTISQFVDELLAASGINSNKSINIDFKGTVNKPDDGGGDPGDDPGRTPGGGTPAEKCRKKGKCMYGGKCQKCKGPAIRTAMMTSADTALGVPDDAIVMVAQAAPVVAPQPDATATGLRTDATAINIYGSVTVMPPTADLAAAISQQLLSQGRA